MQLLLQGKYSRKYNLQVPEMGKYWKKCTQVQYQYFQTNQVQVSSINEPSITWKYLKYFSETSSFNIRQLLSILLLKSARRDRIINELQTSTKESDSF